MKVSYHPEPGTSDETTQFGYDFAGGRPTEVTDEKALAKFRGNPFFKVAKAKEDETSQRRSKGVELLNQREAKPAETGLKAVHNGGGRFVIKDGDTIVKDGLTKADADAFNALSAEDKAEYVKD